MGAFSPVLTCATSGQHQQIQYQLPALYYQIVYEIHVNDNFMSIIATHYTFVLSEHLFAIICFTSISSTQLFNHRMALWL